MPIGVKAQSFGLTAALTELRVEEASRRLAAAARGDMALDDSTRQLRAVVTRPPLSPADIALGAAIGASQSRRIEQVSILDSISVTLTIQAVSASLRDISGGSQLSGGAFGGGVFVLSGEGAGGPLFFSSDGESFSAASTPPAGILEDWRQVAYGNGTFLAVNPDSEGSEEYVVGLSSDGDDWTSVATGIPSTGIASCCFGEGRFVFFVRSGLGFIDAAVYFSDDSGQTWTQGTITYGGALSDLSIGKVAFGGGRFVAAVGENGFLYSDDGEDWFSSAAPDPSPWSEITYGNGVFVATAAQAANDVAVSADGVSWSMADLGVTQLARSIAFAGGRFIVFSVPVTFTSAQLLILSSEDGFSWAEESTPTILFGISNGAVSNGSRIVAMPGLSGAAKVVVVDVAS